MVVECLNENVIKERKLIKLGVQKTLTVDNFKQDNIDWDIVGLFNEIIEIDKVIESNSNCFEVVLKTVGISPSDFKNIQTVSKIVYGDNFSFYFNAENQWQCSFGVKKNGN